MPTILVESRRDEAPGIALDRLAQTCESDGHRVVRWRGPLSGRVPHSRSMAPCDLAVLWNGAHPSYQPHVAALRASGAKMLFVELGWEPQRGHIQVDPQGINACASWACDPLTAAGQTPLQVRPAGDLLMTLQLDRDTQITQLSPWFENMHRFVEFICRHSALPVRVRAHPCQPAADSLVKLVCDLGGSWDSSPSLAAAMEGARALACVNSSSGVAALAAGIPVLCYGGAIYRHEGAAYCLDDQPDLTARVTTELASGRCTLYVERNAELTARIFGRQWPLDAIPHRLPPLLAAMLPAAQPKTVPRWHSRLVSWQRRIVPAPLLHG
jgi:hypothetical protein